MKVFAKLLGLSILIIAILLLILHGITVVERTKASNEIAGINIMLVRELDELVETCAELASMEQRTGSRQGVILKDEVKRSSMGKVYTVSRQCYHGNGYLKVSVSTSTPYGVFREKTVIPLKETETK